MNVLALDQSSSITGVAYVGTSDDDPSPMVLTVRAVRMFGGEPERSFVERLWPTVRPFVDPRVELWLEEAPPTAHKDTNHAEQAAIGFKLGYVGGLVAGAWLVAGGGPVHRVAVSAWRESMFVDSARRGRVLYRPGEAPPPPKPTKAGPRKSGLDKVVPRPGAKGFRVLYRCGHHVDVDDYAGVVGRSTDCPTCSSTPAVGAPGDDVREQWKAIACAYVAASFPDRYAPLVEDARSRAKEVGRPDHKLVGVADACEAVAIGVHACMQ